MNRDKRGRFTKVKYFGFLFILASLVVVIGFALLNTNKKMEEYVQTPVHAEVVKNVATTTVSLEEKYKDRVDELINEIVDRIYAGESAGWEHEEGDLFLTFDPSNAEYKKCVKIGGKQPLSCLSLGPLQLKITMIQHYYPQIYGTDITEMDAFALAHDEKKAREYTADCILQIEGCVWSWSSINTDEEKLWFSTVVPIARKLSEVQ